MSSQPSVLGKDELEAIIAKRVADELTRQLSALEALLPAAAAVAPATEDGGGVSGRNWMQALAMEFATLADQGSGRKRLAPSEVSAREAARVQMLLLIAEAEVAQTPPHYKLNHMQFIANRRVMPVWIDRDHRQQPTEIIWWGIPNEGMTPDNDVAAGIYKAFADSIGAVGVREPGQARVTASGLTIMKGGPAGLESEHTGAARSDPDLVIRGRGSPHPVVETQILGSLMPAARQMY